MSNKPHLELERQKSKAIGMLTHGGYWWDAAKILLNDGAGKKSQAITLSAPIFFLLMQCLEVSLKSYLNARGMSDEKLKRRYGHRLTKLLDKAIELEIEAYHAISPEMRARIELLDPLYAGKDLQYFDQPGMRRYPIASEVLADVGALYDSLDTAYRQALRAAQVDASATKPPA